MSRWTFLALCLYFLAFSCQYSFADGTCRRIGPCTSCSQSELNQIYCQETAYRAEIACLGKNAGSARFESCEPDNSKPFWIFMASTLIVGAVAFAVVHWRKKRLSHLRDVRLAQMVNSR